MVCVSILNIHEEVSGTFSTSSEDSTSVCERPDILASLSRPLISTELLLLALRLSHKVGA